MGKKRTHAETKDGFHKPPPDKEKKNNTLKDRRTTHPKHSLEKRKPDLNFTPQPEWHTVELPELPTVENPAIPPRHVLDGLHQYAEKLLEAEALEYAGMHMSSDSSHKFLSTIMSSGTMEDKVSALTLLIQESPLHTMKAFEQLLGLSRKKGGRSAALMALEALKDLLGQGVLLPPDRKLKAFVRQPGLVSALQGRFSNWKAGDNLPGSIQKIHLIAWAYEDWLKREYFEMLKILEAWCNDEIEHSRSRAVTFVWELLKEKPEQEENLLRLLINKLGDTAKKIASRASYLLLQLQITHPLMKGVIINAIESDLLFRPGQSSHAKYYAIITLNQTVLSVKEQQVANKLLDIYFSLFIGLLKKSKDLDDSKKPNLNKNGFVQGGGGRPGKMAKKKAKAKEEQGHKSEDEMKEKMIAQVLTGVNRAFPFAKTDDEKFEQQLDTIFQVTHSSNFNTSIQALTLIQQISASKHISADRFYRTLYESLLDPRLITSSKQIMYLNLLYRALKADMNIKRVKAFVKRLLQILNLHEPPFICGVLYLVNELITTFPGIKSMLSTPEDNASDDEEEHYEDAPEGSPTAATSEKPEHSQYNPKKRDPEHASADFSCLWELLPLQAHYHPSVHVLASKILHSEPLKEKPDPTLYTLMNFLDKFVYRNPKTKPQATHGSSIMQPMSGTSKAADYLITQRDGAKGMQPVNAERFWRKKLEDVKADEVFFHTYFAKAGKAKLMNRKEKKRKEKEDESDEEGEEEIWKALVNSRPEIEGDDADEEGFSDFDMEDMSDEDGGMDGMGDVELNLDSDEGDEQDVEDEDGMDDFDLESADEEAFVGSEEELPADFDTNDDTEDEAAASVPKKDQKREKEKKAKKRRKLKHLPTFASVDDYAKLLEDEDSE